MITVHHLNNSRSQRVLWLLEELGVPYEIVKYQRDAQTMLAPPELVKVHPLGKSPVITDGGVTVAETGAIVEYLLETHGAGRLRPAAGTPEALRFRYWLHFAEGEWFAGPDFSAADIQMSFPVEAAHQRAGLDASRPKLMAWLKKIHARAGYKKALERGGPYSFAND